MKKALLLLFVLALTGLSLNSAAQCTPNPSQVDFLLPDTATDFPPAFTFMAYDEALYISVPTDTLIFGMPATIDTITFVGIDGLPASITATPNPGTGIFPGGTKACINLSGTPALAEIGTYPLTINVLVTGFLGFLGDTTLAAPVTGYQLRILDSSSFGIYHYVPQYSFSVFQNAPNPFKEVTEIAFTSPGRETVSIEIFDILGKVVFQKEMVSLQGMNTLRFEGDGLKPGVYIYKVSNGEVTFSNRMTLSGE